MTEIEIFPQGRLHVGTAERDGERFLAIRLEDATADQSVSICLSLPHFVSIADHLQMVAQDLMERGMPDD